MITNLDKRVNSRPSSVQPDGQQTATSGALAIPEADLFSLIFTKPQQLPRLDLQARARLVDTFAGWGFSFVQIAHGGKRPIKPNWQYNPLTAQQMKNAPGNVGALLGKQSNNIVCVDLDERAGEFFATFPAMRETLIVWRDNATNRVKVFLRVTDRLPRSTNWERSGEKKPAAELLATGKQAVIVGIHETGAVIKNNGRTPIEMTFADLSAIWRRWTGQELPDPTRTTATTKTQQSRQQRAVDASTSDNPHANEIKQHWDCMKVFAHFGRVGDVVSQRGETRLRGNGGLLVDEVRDVWYCHVEQVGGDCIAAWAWCSGHTGPLTGAVFVQTINEMRMAAGLPAIEKRSSGIDWNAIIAYYSQPEAFERGRYNPCNRSVMTALLDVMKATDNPVIKMSVREAGERAGMSYRTAWKTLGRLIEAGVIAVVDGQSWFGRELQSEDDEHLRNQFDARTFELLPPTVTGVTQRPEVATGDSPSPLVLRTVATSGRSMGADLALDIHTLTSYLDHDAFQWGAKVIDTDCKFGRAALDIIAALELNNDQTAAELADATKRSKSTCAEKANALALVGLVEVYKEGRTNRYYLVDNWRDILERIIGALTTLGRTIKRKMGHLRERIHRAGYALNLAESGYLRLRLAQLLDKWRTRLLALADQLRALLALRAAVFEGVVA
ncbi:MAG: bifunctional DNA primase/polymerase [Caldilineaceae bacterium]